MTKITTQFLQNFSAEKNNLILFAPIFVGFGAAFYFLFEENFLRYFSFLAGLFFAAILFYFVNRQSFRCFVFLACALSLAGSFYGYFYQKTFLNYTKISGKIYVDGVGKISAIQKFTNPVNGVIGANLLISEPKLYKSKFVEKHKVKKKKKAKKPKKIKKKKAKKPKKVTLLTNTTNCHPERSEGSREVQPQEQIHEILRCAQDDSLSKAKANKTKPKKKKKPISEKTILKNFVNLAGYQEIDREFLDYSKNHQRLEWLKINDREVFPNPPPKISLNLVKNAQSLKVNDVIAFRALLQPPKKPEFSDDFDFNLDAKFKKIGAYGFVIGETKTMRVAEISSLDDWFINLRETIRGKILKVISGDEAAIALAFLIGDQSQISSEMMQQIRNSGLAHLLSISGFHLSLASMICFVGCRFLLSRSEYLALRFDLKKVAAIAAILGTYFYLKIAGSPLPAQRAFVMVFLVLLALFVGEKINAKRAIMFAALCLILFNPLAVFNISFQLTFAAILVLANLRFSHDYNEYLPLRIIKYFGQIILISLAIQIATAPFLMHSFRNLSLFGFVANIVAIPISSFVVMPLGFLALFLMIFSAEKFCLILLSKSILLIEKIAQIVGGWKISNLVAPQISGISVSLALCGLLIFCLLQTRLRLIGVLVFLLSFATIFNNKKPDILFDAQQKFFAVETSDGLIFSKNLRASKRRQVWMDKMNEKEFKSLSTNPQSQISCEENRCVIRQNKKFLVLLKRNKISEICKNDFDVIVNLTAKYQLPSCITENKIKIDNRDFYLKGGQFLKYNGEIFTF